MKGKILSNKEQEAACLPRRLWKKILACSLGCAGLFLWRKGVVSPFFALADAFSVSGFFMWGFSVFPALLCSPIFDGASYMARCAFSGWFLLAPRGYTDHQTQRSLRRKQGSKHQEGRLVGGVFFLLGLMMSVIFL